MNIYYLYVWTEDKSGQHSMISGKAYNDRNAVIESAARWSSMQGYHASVICNGKELYKA